MNANDENALFEVGINIILQNHRCFVCIGSNKTIPINVIYLPIIRFMVCYECCGGGGGGGWGGLNRFMARSLDFHSFSLSIVCVCVCVVPFETFYFIGVLCC